MPRGLTGIIGGAMLVLALVVAGLTMYRPPHASYIDVPPEPVGRPAAAVHAPTNGVDAVSAPVDAVPTAATNSTLTFSGQALIVATSVFPAQQQIAPAAPIIISFAAQSEAMRGLCAEIAGVFDSGLCVIRSLTVDTVDDAGVHVPLTAQQFLTLGRVRDAGVALTVARDNALLMATPAAAVVARVPAVTAVSTAAMPVVAPTSAQPRQNRSAGTFVDGLPLLPIAIGVLLVALCIAGAVLVLRRRAGGTAPRAPLPPAGLSLYLGDIKAPPLLDDDAAIAQSVPRAAARSFESASILHEDDDLFVPAPTVSRPMASAVHPTQAAAEPGAGLADSDVFRTPASATGLTGVLADRVVEPIAAMTEVIVSRLGSPLPPAREKGALPPTAALDRQAALRWVRNTP